MSAGSYFETERYIGLRVVQTVLGDRLIYVEDYGRLVRKFKSSSESDGNVVILHLRLDYVEVRQAWSDL
jgi:hypothetical protein